MAAAFCSSFGRVGGRVVFHLESIFLHLLIVSQHREMEFQNKHIKRDL